MKKLLTTAFCLGLAGFLGTLAWLCECLGFALIVNGFPGAHVATGLATLIYAATTVAGSLPKPAWLAEPQKLWAAWRLEGAVLAEGKRDAVLACLKRQEDAGIDIVTDGEQTRRHFVTTLIEGLEGVDFEHRRTVRIRNRYDASVPVVVGPVARRQPIYVDDAVFSEVKFRKVSTEPGVNGDGLIFGRSGRRLPRPIDSRYFSRVALGQPSIPEVLNSGLGASG